MNRKNVKELILLKERPETTLSLIQSLMVPQRTVADYIFTPSIKENFEFILERIAQGKGGGFWIQAEYGAGKTHFLATLASLLKENSEDVWKNAQDKQIRSYYARVKDKKLFPVILSLRGESGVDQEIGLLRVIENHILETLEKYGLAEKVKITTKQEIIKTFKGLKGDLRDTINTFIKRNIQKNPEELSPDELAKQLDNFCKEYPDVINLRATANTKERVKHIYDQVVENGFKGILFIIDEFAFWQDKHPEGSPQYADDENILETLAFVLPRDLGLEIFTVVASQKPAPAKLKGDRFKDILLLAGKNERDYEIIAAKRVRDLVEDKKPEIEQYCTFYYQQFKFFKTISREYFFDVFPFQPRCFEILRKITQRELPTERSGINVAYETINNPEIINRDILISVSDLLVSPHLITCLNASIYQDSYKAYQTALDTIDSFELDDEEKGIAKKIISTLFLYEVAYLGAPKALSIQELTEVTLTIGEMVKNEDSVEIVLNKLRDLPQLEYAKEKGAKFVVKLDREVKPVQIFTVKKRRITELSDILKGWEDGLVLPPEYAEERSLFHGLSFESSVKLTIEYKNIVYPGEYIIARSWKEDYGASLDEDVHFRVVFLTRIQQIDTASIQDTRIAVCVPSELSEEAKEASREYLAVKEMQEEYLSHDKVGVEAEEVRRWLRDKRREVISNLVSKQLSSYKAGNVLSRNQVAINEQKVFQIDNLEWIVRECICPLFSDVYSSLPVDTAVLRRKLSGRDVAKVFEGFFSNHPAGNAVSACDNYAVALRLASRNNPRQFRPDNNEVFKILEKELQEAKGELHVWKIYKFLQVPPYGLLKEIVTLMLFALVKSGAHVEITLKPGHGLGIKANKITAFNLNIVSWRPNFDEELDVLQHSTEISWDTVVSFGRILEPSLKPAVLAEEITEQSNRLLEVCRKIKEGIEHIRQNFSLLTERLQEDVAKEDKELLDSLEKVVVVDNYEGFYEAIKENFSNEQMLQKAKDIFNRYNSISQEGAILVAIISYLSNVVLPENHKLSLTRTTLRSQIKLTSFLTNPSLMYSLREQFEKFKTEYQQEYQIFHRDYNNKLKVLAEQLEGVRAKIQAISNLDSIQALGQFKDNSLEIKFKELFNKAEACLSKDPVSVEESPCCRDCLVALQKETPEEETKEFVRRVNKILETKVRILFQALSGEIFKLDKANKLENLIKVIQLADLEKFAAFLTPDLCQYISSILNQANIQYEPFEFRKEISERFTYIDEGNLEDVVEFMKQKIKNFLENLKKQNKNKNIRITLK